MIDVPSRPAPHDRCWESCELDRSSSCHRRSVEMNREEKAKRFARLHVKGAALLLYNAWDAGSARSVLEAGAKAIATSSWSVAAAQRGTGRRTGRRADIPVHRG